MYAQEDISEGERQPIATGESRIASGRSSHALVAIVPAAACQRRCKQNRCCGQELGILQEQTQQFRARNGRWIVARAPGKMFPSNPPGSSRRIIGSSTPARTSVEGGRCLEDDARERQEDSIERKRGHSRRASPRSR